MDTGINLLNEETMGRKEDQAILELLRGYDQKTIDQTLERIYERHYRTIKTFIMSNYGTDEDAADIFQDSIIVFYNMTKREDFKLSCTIRTYLFSVARNIWYKHLRSKGKEIPFPNEMQNVFSTDTHLDILLESERSNVIARLLDHLGEQCKKILILFYYEKIKLKDIAEIMNYSSEQVAKNKKANCLKHIKQKINSSSHYQKVLKDG